MSGAHRWTASIAAFLLTALSWGCAAEDSGDSLKNNSGLTKAELASLLAEVKGADATGKSASCAPTGEADPSPQTRSWLAASSVEKIISAIKAPPYVLDPRDVVLMVDIGRSDTWLIITVRVQSKRCIGYSLSTRYV
jgi:hypothetical protein